MKRIIFLCLIITLSLSAKNVDDMLGRTVAINDNVTKIYSSSPIALYSLYAIDKDKIAGLNFPFNKKERKYIDKKICNLPILGGWFGQGKIPNAEMILKVNPDIIILPDNIKQVETKMLSMFGDAKMTIFYIKSTSLQEIVNSFEYLGKITSKEQKSLRLMQKNDLRVLKSLRDLRKNLESITPKDSRD